MPAFYGRFLASSEEVRHKFRHTDFDNQHRMLLRSLELTATATEGDCAGLRELKERGETHDRHHLDIGPHLYELWLSAIVETASEFDAEWTDEVERAWRTILSHVIDHMVTHY